LFRFGGKLRCARQPEVQFGALQAVKPLRLHPRHHCAAHHCCYRVSMSVSLSRLLHAGLATVLVATNSTHSMTKTLFPAWAALQYPGVGLQLYQASARSCSVKSQSLQMRAARHMCVPCNMDAHQRHTRSAIPALPLSSMQPASSDRCRPLPGTRHVAAAKQQQLQNCAGTSQCP
jgi:hypothetical protein